MRKFYKVSNFLRKKFNLNVKIHRIKIKNGLDGECKLKKDGSYLIHIDKTLEEAYAIDVLLHEVAHVISLGKDKESPHGSNWGVAYSKVYREFERFNE